MLPRSPRTAASAASAALALAAALVPAAAPAGGYVALDGSSVTLGTAFDEDLNPRGGRLRLGLRVSESFDVEVQAGVTRDDDTASFERFDASWAGLYLKAYLPIGERSAFYALGGAASVELTQSVGGAELTDERGDFSYGFGLETSLTERLDLTADWMRYVGDEGAFERIDAASIGLKLYF